MFPIDGALLYTTLNTVIWTKEGTSLRIGGSFPIVSGTPAITLAESTNTTLGYFNGNMLAVASGVKADTTASGLTAGALYNFDPASVDTGQKYWNGMIICTPFLVEPLAVGATYAGTLQVAQPQSGWQIMQQFLYASGTPATDTTIVANALANYSTFGNTNGLKGTLSFGQVNSQSGADGSLITVFSY